MELWEKQLLKMPWKVKERVSVITRLLFARDFSALNRKKLKGHKNIFRIRVGNYRIIYYDDGKNLSIISIPSRSDTTYNDF